MPDRKASGMRTLGRRLSITKKRTTRYWLVLDGALLTWYKDVSSLTDKIATILRHSGVIDPLFSLDRR
jgi:hypothetical protein